jgi:U3 small nucleolar RNA-associated protein 25
VEELLKLVNKTPKKLSDLNDISRLKEIYTASDPSLEAPKLLRQTIVLSKFRNIDLEYAIEQYCSKNIFGTINLPKIHPNRALEQCTLINGLKLTLRRLPNVESLEHVDDSRFGFFTKQLWDKLYEDNPGYTVLFVPSYLDFVRLRTYLRNKNAQVAFISEYSEKKDCQRSRHAYETKEKPVLVITERAIIFDKIKLRYARSVVMYGLPESPDTFTDVLCEVTREENWDMVMKVRLNLIKNSGKTVSEEDIAKETQNLLKEKRIASMSKSVVGLFSRFDGL